MNTFFRYTTILSRCTVVTGACAMMGGPVMAIITKEHVQTWTALGVAGFFSLMTALGVLGLLKRFVKAKKQPRIVYAR